VALLFTWLDNTFSFLVPLAYLVGLVGGYAPSAAVAVGTALGFAVEVHSWLQQRRVRVIYSSMSRLPHKDSRRAVLKQTFKVQGAILIVLMLFSMWNANLFLAGYWHPDVSAVPNLAAVHHPWLRRTGSVPAHRLPGPAERRPSPLAE
jgi:hypothetical protein